MSNRSSLGVAVLLVTMMMGFYMAREQGFGRPAPAFSLPNGYGGRLDLASYRGRPVLLVFWTTWCGICQRELPLLNGMRTDFESKGVSVLAIHLGSQEEADSYLRANRIYLSSVSDSEGTVGREYHISGLPGLVLVGADGRIKRTSSGWISASALREWIAGVAS
jgi:peroxiredoxin